MATAQNSLVELLGSWEGPFTVHAPFLLDWELQKIT